MSRYAYGYEYDMRNGTKASIVVFVLLLFFGAAGGAFAHRSTASAPPDPAVGKRIDYSVSQQRVSLYENGRRIRSYRVSGRAGVPAPGNYHVFSKSKVSYAGDLRLDNMVRFVPGDDGDDNIGFHAIPVTPEGTPIQTRQELGQYRSHGCVRQGPVNAAFLYDWAPIGTPVVVLP
jgi:hypothetical protein